MIMTIPYTEQAKLMLEKMGENINLNELEQFYTQNEFHISGGTILHYLEMKAAGKLGKDFKIIK